MGKAAVTDSRLQRATRLLLISCGICGAALVATGVVLVYSYTPARPFFAFGPPPSRWSLSNLLRVAHRVLATALVLLALALAVAFLLRSAAGRLAIASATFVVSVLASITGSFLPWDQLAFRSVRVGSYMGGYQPLLSSHASVRFVMIGSKQIGPSTLMRWFWVHIALGAIVPVLLVALALARTRRLRQEGEDLGGAEGLAGHVGANE